MPPVSKKKTESSPKKVKKELPLSLTPHRRIQTAEGWKRSLLKKPKGTIKK